MNRWGKFYNFEGIHGGVGYKYSKNFLGSKGVNFDPWWLNILKIVPKYLRLR
jgi:hypothetical protein